MSVNTSMEANVAEGSFEQKWNEFVEENNLDPVVADKLQFVYYAGAHDLLLALKEAIPEKNTPASIQHSVMAFNALQAEVDEFFDESGEYDDDVSVLTIKQGEESGKADS